MTHPRKNFFKDSFKVYIQQPIFFRANWLFPRYSTFWENVCPGNIIDFKATLLLSSDWLTQLNHATNFVTRAGIEGGDTAQRSLNPRCVYSFVKGKRRRERRKERGIRTERSTRRGHSQNINALNPLWIARCLVVNAFILASMKRRTRMCVQQLGWKEWWEDGLEYKSHSFAKFSESLKEWLEEWRKLMIINK